MGDEKSVGVNADVALLQYFIFTHPPWKNTIHTHTLYVFMLCVNCRQVGGLHSQIHPVITNQSSLQHFARTFNITHSSSLPWRSHFLQNLDSSFCPKQQVLRREDAKYERGGLCDVVKGQTLHRIGLLT